MAATKHTFVVVAEAPEGVSMSEIADHLADASRLAAAGYHASDPMSRLGPIQVLGSIARASLPAFD